jgi:NAD(P)H-hydrate repair Nnr-like enzyme with NAD(P)H-hydrate epimerase domain
MAAAILIVTQGGDGGKELLCATVLASMPYKSESHAARQKKHNQQECNVRRYGSHPFHGGKYKKNTEKNSLRYAETLQAMPLHKMI